MIPQGVNQMVSRSGWIFSLAISCMIFALVSIAGIIVLALIPVYLPSQDIDIDTSQNDTSFNSVFATDVNNGRSLTLSNKNDVSKQMLSNMHRSNNIMKIQPGGFLSATASAKKKRQTSNITIACEQATGLNGDLFITKNIMTYPLTCKSKCRDRYRNQMQNALRMNNQRSTVVMSFTNGETRTVQLEHCSFSTPVIDDQISTSTTSSQATSSAVTSTSITYIYLLDQDSNLFRFNPTTSDVTFIGTLNCSATDYPYSMALQRNGKAWTLFTDGTLYTFDIKTAQCQATSYVSGQEGLILFGMNFITDTSSGKELLYISSDSSNPPYRLATMDPNTLEISVIGYYDTISARAELTGTNDGRLFGLFEGRPYVMAEINRTTAEILSKTSQNMIQYTSDSSHFAFTSYLSNFFLFVGNSSFTDIFLYDSSVKTTTKTKTITNGIVGAGVATDILRI